MENVQHWYKLFVQAINDYHKKDSVDQLIQNPYPENSLDALLYEKNWIDTVQWHLEDIVRDPDIDAEKGMEIKRRIDRSNQKRTDLVERLDDELIPKYSPEKRHPDARLNTESLAWALDRLSILALKIYHMQEEVNRQQKPEKLDFCRQKLHILLEQREDLILSIAELIADIKRGIRYYKVYRQVKMYNDPGLNPVLYNKKSL